MDNPPAVEKIVPITAQSVVHPGFRVPEGTELYPCLPAGEIVCVNCVAIGIPDDPPSRWRRFLHWLGF